ncbi:MAG: PIG-L family deacetylase [Acidobacteriota bacterium]
MRASSALVLAPHYDDEVLGCGGLVAQLAAAGAVVRVFFLSDSGGGQEEAEVRREYSRTRRTEAEQAAKELGVAGLDHLDLPDGRLGQALEVMAAGLRRALLSQRPQLLLVPSPLEVSADHRAVFAAVHRLLGALRSEDPLWHLARDLDILAYEVNHPLHPDVLVDVSDQVEVIERAMACYTSQQEQHDYLGACLGLLRFRTLTLSATGSLAETESSAAAESPSAPGVTAAEAYRRLNLEDFLTRGPAGLIAELEGGGSTIAAVEDGPKISVVVRTKDRPQLLDEALRSLAASTYRRAEIVLVNDGGERPTPPADFPLPLEIVDLETNRGRAGAANAGLAAATGDFVTFLDDDDLAEPEHLSTLAGLVQGAGVRVAYTDAAVGVYELDGETGWHSTGWTCIERRLPYSRDFDPDLLLFDNYIPFNTLIIDRQLAQQTGDLDETLPFFEDWDYLIRLASLTSFHHLARVTCEYRHFRGGGHHIFGERPRERGDFLAMKAKVIAKHALGPRPDQDDGSQPAAATLARAIDRLRADSVQANEEVDRQRRELKQRRDELRRGEERYHQLNGKLTGLEVHQRVLEDSERRAREEWRQREAELLGLQQQVRELTAAVDEQSTTLRQTYGEIERLGDLIKAMESTKAWQLHQWWQRRKA